MSGEQPPPESKKRTSRAERKQEREALGGRPGPMSVFLKVASGVLSGGLIVLLFAAIIPKVTDFDSVAAELKSMNPLTIVAILAAAFLIRIVLAGAYAALMPALSFGKSFIAKEASTAVSNVIPGPSGTASQYVILRSWKISTELFAQAALAVSVASNLVIVAAPGLLFVVWVLLGQPASAGGSHEWAIGVAAVILSAVSVTVVVAIAGSVRLARKVGSIAQACVNPFRRLLDKPKITHWPDACVNLREGLIAALQRHGRRVVAFVITGYALNALLIVACMWACGVSKAELPLSLGVLLFSIGRLLTIVSFTPGGVGVAEIAYTYVFVAVLGESAQDSVVAGVLVYRGLTYLLPIVTGAFSYVIWRIMRIHEKHEAREAEAEAA